MTARHETPPVGIPAEQAARFQALVPVLTTRRLTLRAPQVADFDTYAEIVCGPRGAYIGGPMNREDAWFDFIQLSSCWQLHGHGGWTITGGGETLGFVILGLEPGDQEVELGFLFRAAAEGQGYAREAAIAARNHAFNTLNLPSLVSYIAPKNTRSAALAERLGAYPDGTVDGCTIYRHPNPERPQ